MEGQRKYTVVLVKKHTTCYEPKVIHVVSTDPDVAEVVGCRAGYVVLAVFHGHLEAL